MDEYLAHRYQAMDLEERWRRIDWNFLVLELYMLRRELRERLELPAEEDDGDDDGDEAPAESRTGASVKL